MINRHQSDAPSLTIKRYYGSFLLLILASYSILQIILIPTLPLTYDESLSFLCAILYLIQARQLMRRQFGLLFRRLPSLDGLERMSIGSVELGLPLLFVALSLGHLWMYDLADRVSPEMAALLTYLKGLRPAGKTALAFGSHGWARGPRVVCRARALARRQRPAGAVSSPSERWGSQP